MLESWDLNLEFSVLECWVLNLESSVFLDLESWVFGLAFWVLGLGSWRRRGYGSWVLGFESSVLSA